MPTTINIAKQPTFDLVRIHMKYFDAENRICYFESDEIFHFDRVYGFLNNRSRVTRINKPESTLIEQIISATIDAGYCGHLVWKAKLTGRGHTLIQDIEKNGDVEMLRLFADCQQIHLFPSLAGNYYNGTNQTVLEPQIIFVADTTV